MSDFPTEVKDFITAEFGKSTGRLMLAFVAWIAVSAMLATSLTSLMHWPERSWFCAAGSLLFLCVAIARRRPLPKATANSGAGSAGQSAAIVTIPSVPFWVLSFALAAFAAYDVFRVWNAPIATASPPDVEVTASSALVAPSLAIQMKQAGDKYCLREASARTAAGPDFSVCVKPSPSLHEVLLHSCEIRLLEFHALEEHAFREGLGVGLMNEMLIDVPVGTQVGVTYGPQRICLQSVGVESWMPWKADQATFTEPSWTKVRVIPRFQSPGIYKLSVSLTLTADFLTRHTVNWDPTIVYVLDVEQLDESNGFPDQGGPYSTTDVALAVIGMPNDVRTYKVVRHERPNDAKLP